MRRASSAPKLSVQEYGFVNKALGSSAETELLVPPGLLYYWLFVWNTLDVECFDLICSM